MLRPPCLFAVVVLVAISNRLNAEVAVVPVFQYKAGDSSMDVDAVIKDISGHNNHGTVVGGTIYSSTDVPTVANSGESSFHIDAKNKKSCIVTNKIRLLDNYQVIRHGGFTLDLWFKQITSAGSSKGFASNVRFPTFLSYSAADQIRADVGKNSLQFYISEGKSTVDCAQTLEELMDGDWHHAVGRFVVTDGTRLNPVVGNMHFTVDGITRSKYEVELFAKGDQENQPISVGYHPTQSDTCHFSGLIYNPTVSLGAIPPGYQWGAVLVKVIQIGLVVAISYYAYQLLARAGYKQKDAAKESSASSESGADD